MAKCLLHWKSGISNFSIIQCGAVITRSIFSQMFTKDTHSSPVRARYGVSFVDPASGRYFAWVPVIIYVLFYNIEPRYNGTRLYLETKISKEIRSDNLQFWWKFELFLQWRKSLAFNETGIKNVQSFARIFITKTYLGEQDRLQDIHSAILGACQFLCIRYFCLVSTLVCGID